MEKEKNPEALNFLQNFKNYYLTDNSKNIKPFVNWDISDVVFYRIKRITFEEKAPRKEALENVISSMRIDGVNLIYLILSDGSEVKFYLGVSRDLYKVFQPRELSVNAIGEQILKPSIVGNFRGSIVEKVQPKGTRQIINDILSMDNRAIIEGVPGIDDNKESFQAVDRLVDVMCGESFGVLIVASAHSADEIFAIQNKLEKLYREISFNVKHSMQFGESSQKSRSETMTDGTNESNSDNRSATQQDGTNESHTEGTNTNRSDTQGNNETDGINYKDTGKTRSISKSKSSTKSGGENISDTKGSSKSQSIQSGTTHTKGTSFSKAKQSGTSEGSNESHSFEQYDKTAKDWVDYLDKVIFPRLDYARGRGMFSCSTFLFSGGKASLRRLSNAFISLYSGSEGNRVPLRCTDISSDRNFCNAMKCFQNPIINDLWISSNAEEYARAALSQNISNKECRLGNWYSAGELSLILGLPQKEVHGISLKEEVEFGLNFSVREDGGAQSAARDEFAIGNLVEAGIELKNTPVKLGRSTLNKHIFITGVTGCGKTTTCQNLLIQSEMPFLVIEPAKTEYRVLKSEFSNFVIFTLGNDQISPFRLNPFEFFRHESITSHVDMVRASIEAAFDMEAAIPQIIESAIYKAYHDCGWDIETNRNTLYEQMGKDPFAADSTAFPMLSEVIAAVDAVVEKQGFDTRLKNDYIGSIKARLQSLTIGSKGQMLNTRRSVDLRELLKMNVVLEIEEIKSGNEKAFVMGLVMMQLNEAIKAEFMENTSFKHITLIEEAHRLLTKFMPGDSPNKKHGTEVFADMLSEVRKYGESLIIADQIPDKMIPEVLKNTNTKIVHRLFAQDDKNAIGNTMALTEEQKSFLSFLEVGRAVVFSQDYEKAIQVQIAQRSNTTAPVQVTSDEIHELSRDYLYARRKTAIIPGMQFMEFEKSEFWDFVEQHKKIMNIFNDCLREKKIPRETLSALKSFVGRYGVEASAKYFAYRVNGCLYEAKLNKFEGFLRLVMETEDTDNTYLRKRDRYADYI